MKYIYFSTGFFGEAILKSLIENNCPPSYIITSIDKPVGRKQILTESKIAILGKKNNIPIYKYAKLKDQETLNELKKLIKDVDICIVCDYGKILPQILLDLASFSQSKKPFINIHPSKLPLLRGPAPLPETILQNIKETAVTFIEMDNLMDHGPIIWQENINIENKNFTLFELSDFLGNIAGKLCSEIIPQYIHGEIIAKEQDHQNATYTHMIEKKDSEVFLDKENINDIYRKYKAYKNWLGIFYIYQGKRVKIINMNKDSILEVVEEGRRVEKFESWNVRNNLIVNF